VVVFDLRVSFSCNPSFSFRRKKEKEGLKLKRKRYRNKCGMTTKHKNRPQVLP